MTKYIANPIILVGKSGSGKTTVTNTLVNVYSSKNLKYERIVTYTTRDKRSNESDEDYHFVTNKQFEEIKGLFAECSYSKKGEKTVAYGSLVSDYEPKEDTVKIIILNPEGMMNVLKSIGISNCTIVYLSDDESTLKERLKKRATETEEEINSRLEREREDFKKVSAYSNLMITTGSHSPEWVANIINEYVHGTLNY